ncbi:TonB-dependent receptor domain-containing protein [Massilia terrae]|uniref:TonB-dependent receptor n=1 Tax=Massilia terrae TaxID=1811224 RepID=A0ABT2CTV6_9BURK|nr:TonB-dependent receptor [Massilia terrae]
MGCFAAQPLFAQTTDSAKPATVHPVRPPQDAKSDQKAATTPAKTGDAAKSTTTSTAQEPQAGSEDMATIEVVASRPTNKVDRDVYDLKNDISISNASAADVLNNVPSVTVDQDGNIQLRGNSNVQVMVNGKRDAQFQGQNRGDALNAFPAEAIESIEVINVPGAEFGNEGGSGPIINLVLKRNRKPGTRANLSANKGSNARENGFLNGEHAEGPYSISGNIGVRKDLNTGSRNSQREYLDPQTGDVIGGSNSSTQNRAPRHSVTMASTFTYNVGERDQAGATASYSKFNAQNDSTGNTYRYGLNQVATADYTSHSHSDSPSENFGLGASYSHKSGEPGEEFKFDLRYTGQSNPSDQSVFYDYRLAPARIVNDNQRDNGRRTRILDISTDYQRVVFDTWQLKAGGKVAQTKGSNSTFYSALNPLTGNYEPVPGRTSDFESNDRNAALYTTLSTKFGALSLLGGLRAEYTTLDVRQPLLNEEDKYSYMNWLPSFYATYDLSDTGMLQLRTSRRISRPNERNLNPNLVYLNDYNATQGNPNLEPVNNDLYELAYRDRFFDVDSSFTLFERRESPVVSWRSYPLASDPDVIVTSPVNFGTHDSRGVELAFNVKQLFLEGLSANFSTTISNDKQLRLFNFNFDQQVEQTIHRESAKVRLAYQIGVDSLQLMVNHNGPTLAGQGVNKAFTMTQFSWQHRLSPQMTLNFNVQNVFNVGGMQSFTENEVLRVFSERSKQPRTFNIGLRYQWGGVTGDQRIRNGGRRGDMFDGPRGDRGGRKGGFGGGPGGPGGGGFGGGPGGGGGGPGFD